MTEQLSSSAKLETVDALLRDLRVTSTLYCRSTLTAPWGFGVKAHGLAAFHNSHHRICCTQINSDDFTHTDLLVATVLAEPI